MVLEVPWRLENDSYPGRCALALHCRRSAMDYLPPDDPAGPVLLVFASRKRRGARVALVGDLDVTAVSCLQDWARSFTAGRPPGTVHLDLSDLGFVDAAGLRALAAACALLEKRCAALELTGLPGTLHRLADLTGTRLPGQPGTAPGDDGYGSSYSRAAASPAPAQAQA
jgi:anti-anti-sigma factor